MPQEDRERLEVANAKGIESGIPFSVEYRYYRGGLRNQTRWILASCNFAKDKDGEITEMVGIIQDITERKQAEGIIKDALVEKEVLLKEIHHRVKNNLQVISSMLSLQAGADHNPDARNVLDESQRRVKVMARLHENLHKSDNLSAINARDYFGIIVADAIESSGNKSPSISTHLKVDDIEISTDTAVVCGQILSELYSNCIKHAFPNGSPGNIEVNLHRIGEERIELVVADDGVGMPEGFDIHRSKTLGLRLVDALTIQLHGEISIDSFDGAAIRVTFNSSPL